MGGDGAMEGKEVEEVEVGGGGGLEVGIEIAVDMFMFEDGCSVVVVGRSWMRGMDEEKNERCDV